MVSKATRRSTERILLLQYYFSFIHQSVDDVWNHCASRETLLANRSLCHQAVLQGSFWRSIHHQSGSIKNTSAFNTDRAECERSFRPQPCERGVRTAAAASSPPSFIYVQPEWPSDSPWTEYLFIYLFPLFMSHTSDSSVSVLFIHAVQFIRSWVWMSKSPARWKKKPVSTSMLFLSFFFFKELCRLLFQCAYMYTNAFFFVYRLKKRKHADCDLNWEGFFFYKYLHSLLCLYLETKVMIQTLFPSGEMFQSELTLEAQIIPRDSLSSFIID